MDPQVPEYLYTFNHAARFTLMSSVLLLIWFGASRMSTSKSEARMTAGILSGALFVWLAVAYRLGSTNTYWVVNNPTIPIIQFGLLVPIILAYFLIRRSESVVKMVDAIPLSWLVGVQFYRALGFMFLVLWSQVHLPWQFAMPAGIGDVATGVLAVVVAAMLAKKAVGAVSAAQAWCWFGIGDLMVAVTMGTLTSPGRTHLLALEDPNMLISAYPLVMIPTFAVPLSIILHGICLWKIRRLRAETSSNAAVPA